MKRLLFFVIFIIACYVTVLTCIVSCANMGAGPDGGPFDETPPRIVGMTPPSQVAAGSVAAGKKKKHKSTKFSLFFSEIVTIENPSENVIVSPPQIEMPNIQAVGKRINVELLDSLKPNTTYTIDFSDAIKDNNEGNPLGHYTYIFSTGEKTDTMQMSGYVLNAEDLEPLAGILVGLHPCGDGLEEMWLTDTLFTTTPFDRVARTDAAGYFSIKGVADGANYHAYALKDGDGDFAFSQRSEQIAFSRRVLTPTSFPDTRYDTLWIDSTRYDSIRVVPFTHFQPDDIVLLAFQEENQPRYRKKEERTDLENFKIFFSAPSEHVPVIHGLNFDAADAFVEQRNAGNDTLVYWLRDSLLMQQDTLQFVYDFMAWDDSLNTHVLTADTMQLVSKTPWKKRLESKEKEAEKWQKQLERRHKRGDYSQETPPVEFLDVRVSCGGSIAPNENIILTFPQPLDTIDMAGVHLYLVVDSVATDAPYVLDSVPNNLLKRELMAEWRPDQRYRLVIDSAAVYSIYGVCNAMIKKEFDVDKLDKFGTFFVNMTHLPEIGDSTEVIVQLLDRNGKALYGVDAVKTGENAVRGEFYYLKEGEYFARCIVDRNANGKWDPGLWSERRMPEEVFYCPEKIQVRAGWDINNDWDVAAVPLNRQKPEELVKQKKDGKGKTSAHERNIRRLEERAKGVSGQQSKGGSSMPSGLRF